MLHLSALCVSWQKGMSQVPYMGGGGEKGTHRRHFLLLFYHATFHTTRFLVCYRALTGDPASTGGAARSAGPNGAPRQVLEISIEGNCSAWGRG